MRVNLSCDSYFIVIVKLFCLLKIGAFCNKGVMNSSGLNHFPSNKMFDDAGDAWGKPNFLNRHIEARSPVGRNSAFYSMNHKNRGVAIILNHEFFEIKTLKDRSGTKVDCEKLSSTLQGLGFNVFPYHNLRLKDITKVIEEGKEVKFIFFIKTISRPSDYWSYVMYSDVIDSGSCAFLEEEVL
uniref:(California timema) hypothetical protein n=1 Tax=Timema californicum TaxID=61474 RepID=A0A7R9JA99_TIMCA|nr:unnamed protein product [Timema californicum]